MEKDVIHLFLEAAAVTWLTLPHTDTLRCGPQIDAVKVRKGCVIYFLSELLRYQSWSLSCTKAKTLFAIYHSYLDNWIPACVCNKLGQYFLFLSKSLALFLLLRGAPFCHSSCILMQNNWNKQGQFLKISREPFGLIFFPPNLVSFWACLEGEIGVQSGIRIIKNEEKEDKTSKNNRGLALQSTGPNNNNSNDSFI